MKTITPGQKFRIRVGIGGMYLITKVTPKSVHYTRILDGGGQVGSFTTPRALLDDAVLIEILPEEIHDNPILAQFRKDYATWVLESDGECTLAGAARETLRWRDDPEAHFPPTPEEIHARRVLEKLAAL